MRKTVLILVVLMLVALPSFSATRREIQVALDMVKYANIMNDLIDEAVLVADDQKRVDVYTGEGFDRVKTGERDMTVDEIKTKLTRAIQNIRNYENKVKLYLKTQANTDTATNGLAGLGIDLTTLKKDVDDMGIAVDDIETALTSSDDKTKLKKIGTDTREKVDPLPLLRKYK